MGSMGDGCLHLQPRRSSLNQQPAPCGDAGEDLPAAAALGLEDGGAGLQEVQGGGDGVKEVEGGGAGLQEVEGGGGGAEAVALGHPHGVAAAAKFLDRSRFQRAGVSWQHLE